MFGGIWVGMFGAVSVGVPSRTLPTQGTGSASASAAPAGTASASASGKEKMEPRLLAHFMGADVPSEFLDKLGNAGVTTVSLFASLGGSESEFRQFLGRTGIDIVAVDLASSVLQARIVAA